jgi:hypothetical protein
MVRRVSSPAMMVLSGSFIGQGWARRPPMRRPSARRPPLPTTMMSEGVIVVPRNALVGPLSLAATVFLTSRTDQGVIMPNDKTGQPANDNGPSSTPLLAPSPANRRHQTIRYPRDGRPRKRQWSKHYRPSR